MIVPLTVVANPPSLGKPINPDHKSGSGREDETGFRRADTAHIILPQLTGIGAVQRPEDLKDTSSGRCDRQVPAIAGDGNAACVSLHPNMVFGRGC